MTSEVERCTHDFAQAVTRCPQRPLSATREPTQAAHVGELDDSYALAHGEGGPHRLPGRSRGCNRHWIESGRERPGEGPVARRGDGEATEIDSWPGAANPLRHVLGNLARRE